MTNRLGKAAARRLACWRCGSEFSCGLDETCWCAEEPARLATPRGGQDCLCRDCLRKMAAEGAPGMGNKQK